ncbi:hypothetical protein [Sanyastnella coralliicola]|uniref:hypothetical protein n=1 Tax=Sanyastnella coralliicola TaxID=3069118 RepID=UPI0027BAB0E3|nr:hypothetical protein [Longitalea sp. SCSIO 12813]
MTFYEPRLTLTEIDPATNKWELKTEIYYPAGETGRETSNVVTGSVRNITVEVITDTSFPHNHVVTTTQTIQRQTGEDEIVVTTEKKKKKKGQSAVTYISGSSEGDPSADSNSRAA